MKTGRIIMLSGFIFINVLAFGQEYTFKVLANKGANEMKSGDTWQAVKTGSSLNANDEIKITENSYLGLVHKTGKPMELKQAGNYKVADLAAKIGGGTSVLNKYTDFILSSNSAEAKKNRLSATGAVHRGPGTIKVFLPDNLASGVFSNIVFINWETPKAGGPYIVILSNMFGDELMKSETPETTLQVDLNDPKFVNEGAILVDIKSKADLSSKSEPCLIKKLSPAEHERIKKSFTEITKEVQEETAINKFILAGFYEENKLFIDAITAYEQAIKLAPDVPTYREAFTDFYLRNRLPR